MSRFGRQGLSAAVVGAAALRGQAPPDMQSGIARQLLSQKYSILTADASGNSPRGNALWTFFKDNPNPQTTNIPAPGKLVDGGGTFDAYALTFQVDIDSGDTEFASDGTGYLLADYLRKVISRGAIEMKIGGRTLFSGFGLYHFPQGGGAFIQSSAAYGTTVAATTVSYQGANVVNGDPRSDNKTWFPQPITFRDSDSVSLAVDFGTTITPSASAVMRIMASFWGLETNDAIRA